MVELSEEERDLLLNPQQIHEQEEVPLSTGRFEDPYYKKRLREARAGHEMTLLLIEIYGGVPRRRTEKRGTETSDTETSP